MIYLQAEVEIDEKSILAQMERTEKARRELEREMDKLRNLLQSVKTKEKRDPEESPKE